MWQWIASAGSFPHVRLSRDLRVHPVLETSTRVNESSPLHRRSPGRSADSDRAVADLIRQVVNRIQHSALHASQPGERSRLNRMLRAHIAPHHYDDGLSNAFAAQFLTTNYDKFLQILLHAPVETPRSVLDIGSGGGTFTAALLAARSQHINQIRHLTFIDRSDAQLDLTSRLVRPSIGQFQDRVLAATPRPSVAYINSDFLEHRERKAKRFELILAGHVLTENPATRAELLGRMATSLAANGAILVVEQSDDPLWETFPSLAAKSGLAVSVAESSSVQLDRQRPHSVRWALLRRQGDWRRTLLDKYFTAWRRQDAQLLTEVFSAGATYHEKPFENVITGLEEIVKYWRDRVEIQRHPIPRPIRVVVKDNDVVADWGATFEGATADRIELRGLLWCTADSETRRFLSFSENFRSRTS